VTHAWPLISVLRIVLLKYIILGGKETGKSVSEFLEITKRKVQGIAKDMPVVGRWKSKEGDVFYLAIGTVLAKNGDLLK